MVSFELTDEQREIRDWVHSLAEQEIRPCDQPALRARAVTELEDGADESSMKTRAARQNGDWVINGQKIFITNGGIADVHVVLAAVEPELGTRGQASFVVPPGTKGIR